MSDKICRLEKLKSLGLSESFSEEKLSDKLLEEMYADYIKNKEKAHTGKKIIRSKEKRLSKEDQKYKVALELLNVVLKGIGKCEIVDLTEFKDISRKDILSKNWDDLFDDGLYKIIQHFGRSRIKYFWRKTSSSYIIILIKNVILCCGYSLKAVTRQINIYQGVNHYKRENMVYYSVIE
jgi:Rps23 Pro-64 3,4-dihydroxylase Tpa1-like proline 4-hydroxylase